MQSPVSVTNRPLDYYVSLIEAGQPFSLARYGDGEWRCILGDEGQNCDGHPYYPELGDDLRRTLAEPCDYFYGLVRIAVRTEGERIRRYISENRVTVEWYDGTVFVDASRAGELFPLLRVLRQARLLLVGPAHLRELFRAGFVEVPAANAYLTKDIMLEEILDMASFYDLIAISAGPVAGVLIYELFPLLGKTHTMIDFGSLWDGFVGKHSRKYMRSPAWQALKEKNLNG